MTICQKCGFTLKKEEDILQVYQCPHCQTESANYVTHGEDVAAQQEKLPASSDGFIAISLLGKCLFFLGLFVIVELLFSIVDLLSLFWSNAGECIACYLFLGAITYFIISYNQLWSRLPNQKNINVILAFGLILYFISANSERINTFFHYPLIQNYIFLSFNTLGIIIILGSLAKLFLGTTSPKLKEKQPIKMIYVGLTFLIYYIVSVLPIQYYLLPELEYPYFDLALISINFLISVLIAFVFIKKTRLAECFICSSSVRDLLKMGITWQIIVLVIKSSLLILMLTFIKMKSYEMLMLMGALSSMSSEFLLLSFLLPYIIKIIIFTALFAAKLFIFLSIVRIITETFLPKVASAKVFKKAVKN